MNNDEEIEITTLKEEMKEFGEKNMSKEKKARYIVLRRKQKADRRQTQEIILKEKNKPFEVSYLWLLIPIGIIILIWLSIKYSTPEPYNPDYDPRIENCGPGGTWC